MEEGWREFLKRSTLPATISFVLRSDSRTRTPEDIDSRWQDCTWPYVCHFDPLPVHPCRFSWKLHKIVFRFVSVLRSRFFHWKCAFKIYCSHKHKINCISVGGNSSWTGQGTVHRRLLTIEITICWEMKSAGDWTPNSIEFAAWPTFCKHLLVGQRTLLSVFCFPKIVKSSLMCAIIVLQQQNSCSPCSWVLRLCSDFCHNVLGLLKYFIESF